jgi:hypothetical protein
MADLESARIVQARKYWRRHQLAVNILDETAQANLRRCEQPCDRRIRSAGAEHVDFEAAGSEGAAQLRQESRAVKHGNAGAGHLFAELMG